MIPAGVRLELDGKEGFDRIDFDEMLTSNDMSNSHRCMQRVFVGELSKWEKVNLVVLLVDKRALQVLLQDLVNPLRLSISLRMIG